jgi:hypothetical protein
MKLQQSSRKRFNFYPTAEECAKGAAPIFELCNWRWSRTGTKWGEIPSESEILEACHELQRLAEDQEFCESGRLIFHRELGFGHERP